MFTSYYRLSFPTTSLLALLTLTNCQSEQQASGEKTSTPFSPSEAAAAAVSVTATTGPVADAATVLARPQVPVLSYHQIRDWRATDSKSAKDYIISPADFNAHMQMLADSNYHTIRPDQLQAYLTTGAKLPAKPVMLTFDDGDENQYTNALPTLNKHGFKGVFFIMTVAIRRHGKQPYMDKTQLKQLADAGHAVKAHTWDHHNVKKYQGPDWVTQFQEPKAKIEAITGKPVRYLAYPFGLWNEAAIAELKKYGYIGAYQLSEPKRDANDPLFSIRRIIASGYWSARTLHNAMLNSFKGAATT